MTIYHAMLLLEYTISVNNKNMNNTSNSPISIHELEDIKLILDLQCKESQEASNLDLNSEESKLEAKPKISSLKKK